MYNIATNFQGFSNLESTTNLNGLPITVTIPAYPGGTAFTTIDTQCVLEGRTVITGVAFVNENAAGTEINIPTLSAGNFIFNAVPEGGVSTPTRMSMTSGAASSSLASNPFYKPPNNRNYKLTISSDTVNFPLATVNLYGGSTLTLYVSYINAH